MSNQFNSYDQKSIEVILKEYEYIIKIIISKYKILPKDYDDAMQEGRLGLLKAIYAYENNKGANFNSFASLCIERQILSFLRNQNRKKNKIHNYSYSLDSISEVEVHHLSHYRSEVEEYILSKIYLENIYAKTEVKLSNLERSVFKNYIYGYSILELSESFNIPKKQVYVIIAKVKKKIEEKMNQY